MRSSAVAPRVARIAAPIIVLLVLAALGRGLAFSAAAAVTDPLTCAGYPTPRVFADAQAWWSQTQGATGTGFGHIHVGACIPERELLSAPEALDIRLVMHDNPGRFDHLSLVVKGSGYEETVTRATIPGFTCPMGTCTQWVRMTLDPAMFQHSGRQEVRFRAYVKEPDGNTMTASLNWQLYVDNAMPYEDYGRQAYIRGKGWYTGSEYCEASMTSVPLSDLPLLGTWEPALRMVWHGTSEDLPVTHHEVRVDADFHNGLPGTVLREGAGPWQGTQPVDTSLLTSGRHRLLARSDCDDPRGSTLSGILVVNFRTGLGLPVPSPTIAPSPSPSATSGPTPTPTPTPTPSPSITPPPGGSDIAFRAASSNKNSTGSSLTLAVPLGTLPGDVMVAGISTPGTVAVTPPDGWALVRTDADGAVLTQRVYVRVSTLVQPLTYKWRFSADSKAAGGIVSYRGVDKATPVGAHGGMVNAAGTAFRAPAVETGTPGAMVLTFFGAAASTSVTPPAGMVERAEHGTSGINWEASDSPQAAEGSTGTRTANASTVTRSIGQVLVLRPAP